MSVTAATARRFFMPLTMLWDTEANSSNIGNTGHEPRFDVIVGDVQNLRIED